MMPWIQWQGKHQVDALIVIVDIHRLFHNPGFADG